MSPRFISHVFRVYGTSKLRESAVYIVYGLVVRMLAWQSYSQRLVKEITQKDKALVSSCTVWMAPVASIPSKMCTSSYKGKSEPVRLRLRAGKLCERLETKKGYPD